MLALRMLGPLSTPCRFRYWVWTVFLGACASQPAASPPAAVTSSEPGPPVTVMESSPGPASTIEPAGSSQTCSEMVTAEDGLIDDGEDGDEQIFADGGRGGEWVVSRDSKGTELRVPAAAFAMSKGGANGTAHAARAAGVAGRGDGAWGATLGLALNESKFYDASRYAGVAFWAKRGPGSASALRFRIGDARTVPDGGVCSDCWNDFGKDIQLTPDWKQYVVSFAELQQMPGWGEPRPDALDPTRVWHLSWHVPACGAEFDIWIDEVRFLKCKR